jgi:hypothetical protein
LKDHFGQKAGARVDGDQANVDFLIAQGTAKKVDGNPVEDLVAKALGDGMTKITEGLTQAVDRGRGIGGCALWQGNNAMK